jgi:hypothetical protein
MSSSFFLLQKTRFRWRIRLLAAAFLLSRRCRSMVSHTSKSGKPRTSHATAKHSAISLLPVVDILRCHKQGPSWTPQEAQRGPDTFTLLIPGIVFGRGDFLPFVFFRFGKLFPELEKKRRVRRTSSRKYRWGPCDARRRLCRIERFQCRLHGTTDCILT